MGADPRREQGARPLKTPLRTWLGFGAMALGMFMAILDIQVVVTSLPNIQEALDIPPEKMSWLQTAYLIAEVIAIPLTGLLTRVLTMRGLFVAAIALFSLASLGCAASGGFAALVAWRVVQGFAGGVLIPLVFTAVFLLFPVRQQTVATTLAGVLAVLAPTVGPLAGGWITETYSWHWLFLINIGPGIVAATVAAWFLPAEKTDAAHARRLDIVALILMALALASLEIALKEAPQYGWGSGLVLGLLMLSAASLAAFVRRVLGRETPIVDLSALADRNFALSCALSFLLGIGLYGSVYLMPVFLGFVRGHDSLEIGTIMLVTGLAQLATAPLAVQLERRLDARLLTAAGFALFAVGLGLSAFQTRLSDYDDMFWPQILRGTAIMFCLLPPTRLALGHLAPERVADASGLFNLMRNLGGAIGLALIDTVIYGRGPLHAERMVEKLKAGDIATGRLIGLPEGSLTGIAPQNVDPETVALVRALVEKTALVISINEAWAMLAAFSALAVLSVAFLKPEPVGVTVRCR
ncbi:MAG: DHA2 family efflux MFS transporter permease subunit [Reyranella sp.]|nr:DHA2 family efflux MFS transporter permease subunit [Reyranella sp.]MDP3159434.1 DHA2 family efflux MFS transporter permease subunit [Reyranella sp.]